MYDLVVKEICLAGVLARRQATRGEEARLVERYLTRAARMVPCRSEMFASEEELFRTAARAPGRAAAAILLCDSRGEMLSSKELAQKLRRLRDNGAQRILFGIGPADGWSETARAQACELISFGRITLPHELAQVVAAEQIYRALTILAGHPYHCGH